MTNFKSNLFEGHKKKKKKVVSQIVFEGTVDKKNFNLETVFLTTFPLRNGPGKTKKKYQGMIFVVIHRKIV